MKLRTKLIITSAVIFSIALTGSLFADNKTNTTVQRTNNNFTWGWVQDEKGWQFHDICYTIKNHWAWIDGNDDGVVECYRFDKDGYLMQNTTTPDGYTVNADGEWTVDGKVQQRAYTPDLGDKKTPYAGVINTTGKEPVTDASSIPKITLNQDLYKYIRTIPTEEIPNKEYAGKQLQIATLYNIDYKGEKLQLTALDSANQFTAAKGPAKLFFNNIPEQGIEKEAFFKSLGDENFLDDHRAFSTTGLSDLIFGMNGGYRYISLRHRISNEDSMAYQILLTPGPYDDNTISGLNDVWYIYPDSVVQMGK